MDREELESIGSELFKELELEDQQYLVGQVTNMSSCTLTGSTPNYDVNYDFFIDFS